MLGFGDGVLFLDGTRDTTSLFSNVVVEETASDETYLSWIDLLLYLYRGWRMRNRAKHECDVTGMRMNNTKDTWVERFVREAIGRLVEISPKASLDHTRCLSAARSEAPPPSSAGSACIRTLSGLLTTIAYELWCLSRRTTAPC